MVRIVTDPRGVYPYRCLDCWAGLETLDDCTMHDCEDKYFQGLE